MDDPTKNRYGRDTLRGEEEKIFDLLAEGLTSKQWGELLTAPLELAVHEGNRDLAQTLVRAGAEMGESLITAVGRGHGEIVNDLLENGAYTDAKDDVFGMTPLHYAAFDGKTEMVQLLLLKGADTEAMDRKDRTPLFLAVDYDNVAAALALIAAGANVSRRFTDENIRRFTDENISIMHLAAQGGHVDITRAAIEHGADVDAVDSSQATPLHRAAGSDRVEAIDMLVEAGAKIEARDQDGCTPVHEAVTYSCPAAVLTLLKHGAHVNTQNVYLQTPLHVAAGEAGTPGAVGIVDSLLRSGADETILDKYGRAAADEVGLLSARTIFWVAEDVGRVRELLVNAPADRAWRRRGYLVLCRARPDRLRQILHESSGVHDGVERSISTETGSCTGTAGDGTVDGRTGGNWAGIMARVLGLQEEGIFRAIVGYL